MCSVHPVCFSAFYYRIENSQTTKEVHIIRPYFWIPIPCHTWVLILNFNSYIFHYKNFLSYVIMINSMHFYPNLKILFISSIRIMEDFCLSSLKNTSFSFLPSIQEFFTCCRHYFSAVQTEPNILSSLSLTQDNLCYFS